MSINTATVGKIATALAAVLFAWPALYNGQGIFFPDTTAYIRGADAGIQAAVHRRSAWSLPTADTTVAPGGSAAPSGPPTSVSSIKDKTVLTGRSPFYGALLYVGDWLGGFWTSIAVQSLAILATLLLTLRAVRIRQTLLPGIALALILLTALPFFVSFLMPDVFTGVVIAGGAVLLSRAAQLSRMELLAWWVLLSAGVLFHDSHTLILGSMLLIGAVLSVLRRDRSTLAGLGVMFAALLVGAAGQAAFGMAVKHSVGAPPLRPPFLTARLIEDGPGVAYLRASCPASGFETCAYLNRLPMMADDFLWQTTPGQDVFATAAADTKRRMSAEQFRFARGVLAFDPLGQLARSARNAALELVSVGLFEFQYLPEEKAAFEQKVPPGTWQRMRASAAFRGTMPLGFFEPIIVISFYAALVFIALTLARRRVRTKLLPGVASVSYWILLGVVLNAIVCGVLPGPHERYATRVEWLVPFAALLIGASLAALRRNAALNGRDERVVPASEAH